MEYLEEDGFRVKLCRDGASGIKTVRQEHFDLCILDVMMPQVDGFTLAQKIKEYDKELPFLFLTAKSRKEDKMKGYELGAEDFITKPFDEDELLCKIKVILRRKESEIQQAPTSAQFNIGSYFFDYDLQELWHNGHMQRVTEKEKEVLRLLCLNKNQILKRDEAVEKMYGRKDYFSGRSFDVFISRIRKMLKDDPNVTIENVFGVGFILKVNEA